METGYPGNGEFPRTYEWVKVITRKKRTGLAYWSGQRWMTNQTWFITEKGPDKVVKWSTKV